MADFARLVLDADTKGLKRGEQDLKRLGKQAGSTAVDVDSMAFKIGSSLRRIAGPAAIGAAIIGFAHLARSAINTADEISKAAQKIGIGTEELSRLRYAADLSGVSFQQLQTGVGILSRNMLEASNGTGRAADAFGRLGISVRGADGNLKNSTAILGDLADKFATMPDGAEKTALAMEVLGRSGASMIPMLNGGREALEKLTGEADKFGIVIDAETGRKAEAFNDNLTRLQGVFGALAAQIAAELLPALVSLTDWLVRNAGAVRAMASEFAKAIQGLEFLASKAMQAARALRDFFAPAVDMARKGLNALGLGGGGGGNSYLDVMNSLKSAAMETAPAMFNVGSGANFASSGIGRVAKSAKAATAAIRETRDELLDLTERLFPERRTRADMSNLDLLRANAGRLEGMGIDVTDARLRVLGANDNNLPISKELLGQGPVNGDVSKAISDYVDTVIDARRKTLESNKAIGDSFGTMADRALQALDRLAGGLRSGDFLSILSGVLGLGLQLGGLGLFGSKVAASVNSQSRSFDGGGFTGSGPRSGGVDGKGGFPAILHPNETVVDHTKGQGGGKVVVINNSSFAEVFVDGKIVQAAPAMMQGGAKVAQAQMSRMQSRRVA